MRTFIIFPPRQIDVCASALSEVIPAVLEGSDGCLLAIGYPGAGEKFYANWKNISRLISSP